MKIKAILRNYRTAPRKTRDVIDLIRGKKVPEAKALLLFATRKSAPIVLRLLNSAISSAKNNFKLDEENLFVSKIFVDEGVKLKRWQAMSRGRAYPIKKRVSHITIVLDDIKNMKVKNRNKFKNSNSKTI